MITGEDQGATKRGNDEESAGAISATLVERLWKTVKVNPIKSQP